MSSFIYQEALHVSVGQLVIFLKKFQLLLGFAHFQVAVLASSAFCSLHSCIQITLMDPDL